MNNHQRTSSITNGFNLGHQIDQEIRHLNRSPIPHQWHTSLRSHPNIQSVVNTIRRFDAESDQLTQLLLDTPIGDERATTVLVAGLLPGVIRRNRFQPQRIADIIAELTIVVAARQQVSPTRRASIVCMDTAEQRSMQASARQARYLERTSPLPSGIDVRTDGDTEGIALLHVQLAEIRTMLSHSCPDIRLDDFLELASRPSPGAGERQRLSRQRRRLRPVVNAILAEAA